MKRNTLLVLLASLLLTSCFNEGTLVSNPAPLMQYQYKPTEANLVALAKTYAEAINNNLQQKVIHPGLYADYGIALARLGCLDVANTMFNNEKTFFPNSAQYVDYLKRTLTPHQASNTNTDTTLINLSTLDTITITLTPEEIALQQQIESDPEYQKLQKQLAKEEKEQAAREAKEAKQQLAKAREAERKAQAREKAKLQKEREQAKKAETKAKAAAKKAADKEKAAAKKAAQKEREQAKKAAEKAKTDNGKQANSPS